MADGSGSFFIINDLIGIPMRTLKIQNALANLLISSHTLLFLLVFFARGKN